MDFLSSAQITMKWKAILGERWIESPVERWCLHFVENYSIVVGIIRQNTERRSTDIQPFPYKCIVQAKDLSICFTKASQWHLWFTTAQYIHFLWRGKNYHQTMNHTTPNSRINSGGRDLGSKRSRVLSLYGEKKKSAGQAVSIPSYQSLRLNECLRPFYKVCNVPSHCRRNIWLGAR